MSLFEKATRQKLRFPSIKGELSVEQLWELPLTSVIGFDLDSVAKAINKTVKESAEESFVSTSVNSVNEKATLSLEVVKHVISVKITEADNATKAQGKRLERQKLLEALERTKDSELSELSAEEIQKRIDALGE